MNSRFPAALLALAFALSACGASDDNDRAPESADTMTVAGTLLVPQGSPSVKPCYPARGYEDLAGSSDVTVYGADGTMLAVGNTEATGEVRNVQGFYKCVYRFSLADVPAQDNVYSVEVGRRGRINFNKAESNKLVLSLGS